MKKKKKLLIAAGVIVVGCIGAYLFFSNQKPAPAQVQTAALKPTTLRSTVEASGLVESTDDANVYSEVAAPIKHVAVKAGDHVSAGQLLCELDDKDVQDTLKQKEIALSAGAQASAQKIKSAQKKYDQDRSTLSSGLNTQINTAKDQVVTAQRTLDDAKNKQAVNQARVDQEVKDKLITYQSNLKDAKVKLDRARKAYSDLKEEVGDQYDDLKEDVSDQEKVVKDRQALVDNLKKLLPTDITDPSYGSIKTRLDTAEAELASDKATLEKYQKELDDYEEEREEDGKDSLKQLRQNQEDAQRAYDTALKSLSAAQTSAENAAADEMRDYNKAVEDAQVAYGSAVRALSEAQTTVAQGLDTTKDSIESEKIAANDEALRAEIQSAKTSLSKYRITAPVSGTITQVLAEDNATPQGLLFVIEDTNALQVAVKVKEYDVNSIKEGMKAVVTADATGDKEYEGVVQKIYPAALKSADGKETTGSDVEFEADVLVQTADSDLKIGMNAKAQIILEEKQNVLTVPFDALVEGGKDGPAIYTPQKNKDGTYTVKAIPVKTGLENDIETEITGEGISAGTLFLSDVKAAAPGKVIALAPSGKSASASEAAP